MASSAGVPSGSAQGGGSGDGGGHGAGTGGKGNGSGTAPNTWHFKLGGKGKGKTMQVWAAGLRSEVHHSLSLPNPDAISISSHMSIGTDGTIEDAFVTTQLEFADGDGIPGGGAAVAISLDTEGTSSDKNWLDEVKMDVVSWRD